MGFEKQREIPVIVQYQITHHAYVDLIGLLKSLPVWFNGRQYDFYEKGLGEKDLGPGYEVESEWVASREVTEYVKFEMSILVRAKDVRKVVLETGEETYWSRLLIVIGAKMVKDWQGKFKPYGTEELFRQWYERFFAAKELKEYTNKLAMETVDLIATMKSFLQ